MPLPSTFPDIDIPEISANDYVLQAATRFPGRPAVVDGITGETLSFAQLAGYVDRFAAALAERGIGKGDIVAVFCPNNIYYPVVFHGIAKAGAISTTINSLYTPNEIAFQLKDAGAKLLITVSPFLDRALAAAELHPVEAIIVLDGAEGHESLRDLLATQAPSVDVAIDAANDLITLPYSSGTTGLPKGVMLTHRNMVANIRQCEALFDVDETQRIIAVLPFFHIYGLTVLMNIGLASGAALVTLPRFDLEQFLTTIQEQKVTRIYAAPPMVLALAKHPIVANYDLSSVQVIFSGAAPLDQELALLCEKRLDLRVCQGYGMTELSPVSHSTPDGVEVPRGCVGVALPNTESQLIDPETGDEAAPGERGELLVRGPQVMRGYLNNPEATAETVDGEGWLHTGDVALVDEDGFFWIVDRVKELIKYKGYQVAPAELEAVLLTHPSIADAAVIGVPDEEGGEAPKAFVVLAAGTELSAAEVMEFVTSKVSPHKKVRHVEFLDAIPKAASGKIFRKDLRARERENAAS